ncbi:family 1 glycosylhydrolase [Schleiferilactobacillus perolens]|uniref:Beta-glucosidase n=1 Tax=Schleiferilactobacillus perolens DSM 12744 TaxID=1423792 RepID=A0A0R1N2F5_9LACO|nr:family 1 glycosylhydrolase [Schleiferilactobacillus perolens]KRL14502.1 hypothetical protein FD09_GL000150 [Schleiferilactobacillus perolens DSM 12744]
MIDPFSFPNIHFPEQFLFGAATAGEQVEGNNKSQFDTRVYQQNVENEGMQYALPGKAANSWEQFPDDVALLKKMHLNLYRMSIEWSRIEPERGHYDEVAVAHYIDQFKQLREAGIKICLTLHHFAHPQWFEKQGAFRTLDNVSEFQKYLTYIVPKVAPYVDYWIVINESNLPFQYSITERMNLLTYHAIGYGLIKKYSDKPVSSAISFSPKHPFRGSENSLDQLMAKWLDYTENEYFIHALRTGEVTMPEHDAYTVEGLKDSFDYWAVNIYVRQNIDGHKADYRSGDYAATHLDVLPHPFYMEEISPEIIIDMAARFSDKPILITENGFATTNDDVRIVYIAEMLQEIHQAIQMGYPIIGYTHWSLLDNWEWGDTTPTFGLASVDGQFNRHLKHSGEFYGDIAESGQLTQEILRQYLHEQPKLD